MFDEAKIQEFLRLLPHDERNKVLKNVVGQLNDSIQGRTQKGLIDRFQKSRARFVQPGGYFAKTSPDTTHVANAFDTDSKPPLNDTNSLESLKPILIQELLIGTTHRGRYLCGWVAIDDAFFALASTTLLLEDVTGQFVELAVYGLVDPELPRHEKQRIVASCFRKGDPIVVVEPYYKVRQDMTEGIRIEQPKELMSWKRAPRDFATWKTLGNAFFTVVNTRNQGRGALACYERAIETVAMDVKQMAVLFSNLATCRFKLKEFRAAMQFAGAAVHLNPGYSKAWYRLAASLDEIASTQEDKRHYHHIAQSVVAQACQVVPNLSTKDRRLLENVLTKETMILKEKSRFQSYVEWCAEIEASACFVATTLEANELGEDTDTFRKRGCEYFLKGVFQAAEKCFEKGVQTLLSCSRNVSLVLNNIAAVHLRLHHETTDVPNISLATRDTSIHTAENQLPSLELAVLNCTVAGIIDLLNATAWTRRARCLQKLGFPQTTSIDELNAIRINVVSKADSSTANRKRIEEFKTRIAAEVDRQSKQTICQQTMHQVSTVSTNEQRKQRDARNCDTIASAVFEKKSKDCFPTLDDKEEGSIDQYIARMEMFENMMHLGLSASASSSRKQTKSIPREMQMFIKSTPPNIALEFPRARGWPEGVDPVFANKVLYRAYLDASASPWLKALSIRTGAFDKAITRGDLIKRWHGTAALEILQAKGREVTFGDVIDPRTHQSEVLPEYDARIRSNFANNPNRAEVYFFGTTHVAIGFNDLSSLVCATLQPCADFEGPLRFVGFEMSEFAVAKCKVLAHMLGSQDCSIWSGLEVWLSSTWSLTTLDDFRKSLAAVLTSLDEQQENGKVMSYLKYWASTAPISAAKARSEFILNMERYNSKVLLAIASFKREVDRLDLTAYLLTGELRASPIVLKMMEKETLDTKPQVSTSGKSRAKKNRRKKKANEEKAAKSGSESHLVGSLTMWNVPFGAPPLEEDIALNIVEFTSLLKEFVEQEKKPTTDIDKLSIVNLFVLHIARKLRHPRALILANKLTIEVLYGVVKAICGNPATEQENQRLLSCIAELRPYTISWSNVLDYFVPADFHDLARRCSIYGDCMHYGYSMNWSTQVLGASILDNDSNESKLLVDTILDTALGFSKNSNVPAESPFAFDYGHVFKMMGLDKLLTWPFRDNILNGTGYILAHVYKQHWINHFLKMGQLSSKAEHRLGTFCTRSNSGLQKGLMDLAPPSPLYRTSLTLYLSWCYDPSLRLQGANDPFEVTAATNKV